VFLGSRTSNVLLCTMLLFSSRRRLCELCSQTGYACIKCTWWLRTSADPVRRQIQDRRLYGDAQGLKIPIAMFAYGGLTHTGLDQPSPATAHRRERQHHAGPDFRVHRRALLRGCWRFLQVTYNGNSKGMSIDTPTSESRTTS